MSDEPNLAALIADRKGTRSYEKISQDCGGLPTAKRVHQLATQPQKNFPDPDTIRGLARGLGVTVTDVVMAAARTLGLPVYTGNDPSALSIGGAGNLDDSAKEALSTVAREFIRLTSQRKDGADHGTGTEEEQEPRPQAGGKEHSSTPGGDRPRRSSSMKQTITRIGTGKADALNHEEQDHGLDHAELSHFPEFEGDMPDPSTLSPEEIWAARTTDDMSGMKPEGESDDTA